MEVNMLRKVSTLSVAGALIAGMLISTPAYAAVSNGSTCTVVNKTTKVGKITYKCVTAVKSTVTLSGKNATIYIPATASTKNAKKYYLANDCITKSAFYAISVKDLATLEKDTAEVNLEIDAQIADLNKSNASTQTQIEALTKENADIALKIKENELALTENKQKVTDLTAKIAGITKQIEDFTVTLNDSKAKLAALKADTANATKNAANITKLSNAISQLSSAINSLKSSNIYTKLQMQSLSNSVSDYTTTISQFKNTITKNLATIESSKELGTSVATLNENKKLSSSQLLQAKNALTQTKNLRDLLCRLGK
jgi:chromosome segregation ATPase